MVGVWSAAAPSRGGVAFVWGQTQKEAPLLGVQEGRPSGCGSGRAACPVGADGDLGGDRDVGRAGVRLDHGAEDGEGPGLAARLSGALDVVHDA